VDPSPHHRGSVVAVTGVLWPFDVNIVEIKLDDVCIIDLGVLVSCSSACKIVPVMAITQPFCSRAYQLGIATLSTNFRTL
jgi:hypothetical protein